MLTNYYILSRKKKRVTFTREETRMYIVANMKKKAFLFSESLLQLLPQILETETRKRMKSLIQVTKNSYGNKNLIVQIHRDSNLCS